MSSKGLTRFDRLSNALLLTEAKDIYWHGTDSLSARKILKMGFVPMSRRGRMSRLQDVRTYGMGSGSLASFDGTYFSQSFMTAYSGATERCRRLNKEGVTPVIFEAILESRDAAYDEDLLPEMNRIVYETLSLFVGAYLSKEKVGKYIPGGEYYEQDPKVRIAYSSFIKESADRWILDFSGHGIERFSPKSVNRILVEKIRPLLIRWAKLEMERFSEEGEEARISRKETPAIREVRDKLYRALYSQPARIERKTYSGRNLRVLKPISYRGSSRILSAVQLVNDMTRDYLKEPSILRVVYGSLSPQFYQGWEQWLRSPYKVERGPLLSPQRVMLLKG